MKRTTTAVLLTCAAIGVAGALLILPSNWLSFALSPIAPFLGAGLVGIWLMPAYVALRLMQRPGVGILVGLISGIVLIPFTPQGIGVVYTNVWFAFFAELPFLLGMYRFWRTWMYYAGMAFAVLVWLAFAWVSFDMSSLAPWAWFAFAAWLVVCGAVATAIALFVADRLAATGVGRTTRRRAPLGGMGRGSGPAGQH